MEIFSEGRSDSMFLEADKTGLNTPRKNLGLTDGQEIFNLWNHCANKKLVVIITYVK